MKERYLVPAEGKHIWLLFCILTALFFASQSQDLNYSLHIAEKTEALDSDTFYEDLEQGTLNKRIGVLSLGLFGIYCLFRCRRNRLRFNGFMGFSIMFFFLWIFLSIFWSDDYMLTARRSVAFTLLWIAALGFNLKFTQKEIFKFLLFACMANVLLGLGVELALGTFPPSNIDYRFSGTHHPNHQAWNAAGIIFAGIALYNRESRHKILLMLMTFSGFLALILTRSRTSVLACLIALAVYAVLVSRKKKVVFYTIGIVSLLCLLLLIFGPEFFGNSRKAILLGRMADITTFTGRSLIWEFSMDYFYEQPLIGYGFNSFETADHIAEYERMTGWIATHVHSEYLGLLLGAGIIGVIAYLLIIINGLLKTLELFRSSKNKYYAMECAILLYCFAVMLMENLSANPNIITFMFFVILIRRAFIIESGVNNCTRSINKN